MPQPRISMKHIRDVLHYRHKDGCSKRQIASYLQLSPGTVRNYLRRAVAVGLSWPLSSDLNDEALSALLLPPRVLPDRAQPNWAMIHRRLSLRGMTLERAWHEYRRVYLDGYFYGHFCVLYRQWCLATKLLTVAGIKSFATRHVYSPI